MTPICTCECLPYFDVDTAARSRDFNDSANSTPAQHLSHGHSLIPLFCCDSRAPVLPLADPCCYGMDELPEAHSLRERVSKILQSHLQLNTAEGSQSVEDDEEFEHSPVFSHFAYGLAYTTGSATGVVPPTTGMCYNAYLVPNRTGLTAGARAWSKHAHRSQSGTASAGWWGRARGPVAVINEGAVKLFWKIMNRRSWVNLHWLPHKVLVYEVRVQEGYGMRWSQDQSNLESGDDDSDYGCWMFRGFLEPAMANGHEIGWRHPLDI